MLRPDETLLWSGRPYQGLFAFSKQDAFLVPFSLVWAGFALFWNVGVWIADAPLLFRLFGLPFLAVGLYVTVGRFIHNFYRRSKIGYALTDQRALFISEGLTHSVSEWPLRPHMPIETTTRSSGQGSIYFDPSENAHKMSPFGSRGTQQWAIWAGPPLAKFVFYRIDDVQMVARLVQSVVHRPQDD